MGETVRDMELNIRYVSEGIFRDRELYGDSPVKVLVDHPELIQDTSLYLLLGEGNTLTVRDPRGNILHEGHFSERISIGDYGISIERTASLDAEQIHELRVDLQSYETATKEFYKKLEISPLEKNTNAIRLSVKDAIPRRGEELIKALIHRYNRNGVADKQIVSAKTVEFINDRLEVINRELGTIENDAERFKKTNKLTNIVSDAEFVMERKKQAGTERLKLQTELDVIQNIRLLMEKKEGAEFGLLPENLGVSDEGLNSAITRYNEMILRRNKLLLSAREDNPIVTGLDMQLRAMKNSIRDAIGNVENGLAIKIKTLEKESQSVDERLTSVPTQEKLYRAIARQQELKENLFLFLMQKREEAEIAKLVYVPTAKIIEDPDAGEGPIAPKKALILLLALVMGGAIPFGMVVGKDMLDTKIRDIEDIERVVQVPLLGTFPEVENGKVLIGDEDFLQTESMHLVREKLNYMLKARECPVVMVTSTIPGEGKSLIATHLAAAYAKVGKKVLVIGCDLRNPSLHHFTGRDEQLGLSAFLAGMEDIPSRLIHAVNDHLDVLYGGAIPPNPVQLIASQRMADLLRAMRDRYTCIILDTPPIGMLSDGLALSHLADACVYVARANVLKKDALRFLAQVEKEGRLTNLGILLNGVKSGVGGYRYGYGYGYGYGKKKDK